MIAVVSLTAEFVITRVMIVSVFIPVFVYDSYRYYSFYRYYDDGNYHCYFCLYHYPGRSLFFLRFAVLFFVTAVVAIVLTFLLVSVIIMATILAISSLLQTPGTLNH